MALFKKNNKTKQTKTYWLHFLTTKMWQTHGRKWAGKRFQCSYKDKAKAQKQLLWETSQEHVTKRDTWCRGARLRGNLHPWVRWNVYTPVSFLFSEPCNVWSSLVLESVWGLSLGPEAGGQFSSVSSWQAPAERVEERRLARTASPCWTGGGAPCCWAIAVRRQLSHCCLW